MLCLEYYFENFATYLKFGMNFSCIVIENYINKNLIN